VFWKSTFTNMGSDEFRKFWGPAGVDQQLRNVINMMVMSSLPQRKTINQVEVEVRQAFERILKELREKGPAFGEGSSD
jgi:hypothetical protein